MERDRLGLQLAPKVHLERQTRSLPPYIRQRPTAVFVIQVPSDVRPDGMKRLKEEETVQAWRFAEAGREGYSAFFEELADLEWMEALGSRVSRAG